MAQEIKAEIESIDKIRRKLEITVPAEEVGQEFDRAYRGLKKKVTMPGFRRGHVPLRILRQVYAQDVQTDVARELISNAYHKALKQTGADPIGPPEIKDYNLEEGEPLTFSAEFEVRPEIKIPAYKGLSVTAEVEKVTEEDILRVLEDLRVRVAPVAGVTEDRPIREGDIAIIDFEGYQNGEPLPGGKGEEYPLEIGSKSFIPGFEDALLGLKAGEEKQFVLTFPEDYQQAEIAGKEVQFIASIKAIKERILPDIDDEFARDVGDYSDLADLKKKVHDNLASVREKEAGSEIKQKLMDKLLETTKFDLPQSMIEIEKSNIERDYRRKLSIRSIHPNEIKKQVEAAGPDIEKTASRNVQASLILDEIARLEEIKVERGDLDSALKDLAERYKKPVVELRKEMIKTGAMENFHQMLLEEKTLEFLLENNDTNMETIETEKGKGGQ